MDKQNEKLLLEQVKEQGVVEIIKFYKEQLDWVSIIEKYNRDWPVICHRVKMSEDFIIAYKDEVDWKVVSARQSLSEKFIMEFKKRVDWVNIEDNQFLSDTFLDIPLIKTIFAANEVVRTARADIIVQQAQLQQLQQLQAQQQARQQARHAADRARQQARHAARLQVIAESDARHARERQHHQDVEAARQVQIAARQVAHHSPEGGYKRGLIRAINLFNKNAQMQHVVRHYITLDRFPQVSREFLRKTLLELKQSVYMIFDEAFPDGEMNLTELHRELNIRRDRLRTEFNLTTDGVELNYLRPSTVGDINRMKVVNLKTTCRQLGLPLIGTRKAQIKQELQTFLADPRFQY